MAFSYPNTPVLSKVQIGGQTYYLKDADARAILDAAITAWDYTDPTALTTAGAVKQYVDSQIETIPEFDAVVSTNAATTPEGVTWDDHGTTITGTLEASDATFHKIYLVPSDKAQAGTYVEYITLRTGSSPNYTYSWEQVGSTDIDLKDYLKDTATVAGVAFGNDQAITVAELEASTALNLKALAHKDSASTTLNDYATGITGASYTPAGDVSVQLSQTSTGATITSTAYTPEGTVGLTQTTNTTVTYDKVNSSVAITAQAAGGGEATYTPSGSVEVTTVTVTPATGTAATVTSAGTAYELSGGSVTHAADTTSSFATAGVIASVGENETLILSSATTTNAVTAVGAITYTSPTLNGALPTFGTQNVVTGITSATATATFTGEGTILTGEASTTAVGATVTQPVFTAAFTGTERADAIVTAVNYDKATLSSATFAGTSATITPTLTTGDKVVTVS